MTWDSIVERAVRNETNPSDTFPGALGNLASRISPHPQSLLSSSQHAQACNVGRTDGHPSTHFDNRGEISSVNDTLFNPRADSAVIYVCQRARNLCSALAWREPVRQNFRAVLLRIPLVLACPGHDGSALPSLGVTLFSS